MAIFNVYVFAWHASRLSLSSWYGDDSIGSSFISMDSIMNTSANTHRGRYDIRMNSWHHPMEKEEFQKKSIERHPTSSSTSSSKYHKNAPVAAAIDLDDIIAQQEYALNQTEYKFFMYDDPNITLGPSVWPEGAKLNRNAWRMCANEIYFDESLFVVLERSLLRTFNPDEADVFIAPIPNGRIFGSMMRHIFWGLSINTLMNHEVFRKHHGHRHLLIATGYPLFRNFVSALAEYYDKLENITLVQSWDPNGIKKAIDNGYDLREYKEYFTKFQPATRSSISVGLGTRPDSSIIPQQDFKFANYEQIPLILASMEKWRNASNFVFYHTRTTPSLYNSTIYRHAPVTNVTLSNLPKSSIGWDIASNEQWLKEYVDSKFCLVIRGDSPHSKAFIRSVRVGCIPVVVADSLPIFAPVLKSTLNMSDYTVMLDERKFVEDPEAHLLSLLDIDEEEISNKIKHLAFAQKVMMLDHPESLFVPALLHEAVETFKYVKA